MSEGGDFLLVLWAPTLACPASSPTDLMPPNISRGNRLTVLRLWDGRQATLIIPHNPWQLDALGHGHRNSDGIFFAGRLLAVSPFAVWELLGGCRAECLELRTSAWESHIG